MKSPLIINIIVYAAGMIVLVSGVILASIPITSFVNWDELWRTNPFDFYFSSFFALVLGTVGLCVIIGYYKQGKQRDE
jgi:hypothetical protein